MSKGPPYLLQAFLTSLDTAYRAKEPGPEDIMFCPPSILYIWIPGYS